MTRRLVTGGSEAAVPRQHVQRRQDMLMSRFWRGSSVWLLILRIVW